MSEKIITFSIAAYNVEKYIDECVGSILSSGDPEDIEILIIDDGSSDGTAHIAGEYEKKHAGAVRLICKENGGHGSTINTGIEEARGKYFRAVDGDDWVSSEDTKVLIERLKTEDSDLILCNYLNFFEGDNVTETRFWNAVDGKVYPVGDTEDAYYWMNYHSVIYKTEILKNNNIHLDEHCFYVDTEFMAFPVPFIDTVRYYDLDIYCYRRDNEGQSVSESSRMKNILHSKKVAIRLLRFLKKNEKTLDPGKKRYLQRGLAGHCLWHSRGLTFFAPDEEKRKDLICFERYVKRMSPEVFDLMIVPAANRLEGDTNIIKHIRRFNYKTFNLYGIYRSLKNKVKNKIR